MEIVILFRERSIDGLHSKEKFRLMGCHGQFSLLHERKKENHESKNVITKKHHHSDGNLKILTNQRSSTNLQFARCSWRCFYRWAEHSGVGASEILISRRLRIALAEKQHLESATGNPVESAPRKRTSAKRLRRSRVVRSRSVSEPISEGTT